MSAQGFRWSTRREEAALLVAEDELTNQQIADRIGVSRHTLDGWKRHPEFAGRVASHLDAQRAALFARGIADRDARLAALDDRWKRLRMVVEARAREMAGVPGGESGFLLRRTRRVILTAHPDSTPERTIRREPVDEYVLDTALLRAIDNLERLAARQLGQWDVPPAPPDRFEDEIPPEWETDEPEAYVPHPLPDPGRGPGG